MDNYRGREQSYIKHLFLTQYLQSLSFKIFQGRSNVFNFIDAFAGPWRTTADDHSDASFQQSLRTLESVRDTIDPHGGRGLRIQLFLCEKRAKAARELRKFAQENQEFEISVFEGKFENNLNQIKSQCRDGFTFTFIDPTGWNIDSGPVFSFLRDLKGEFLLNFMSEHINRHAGYHKVSNSFGRFLADPDWQEEFGRLPSDWNNEKCIRTLLIKKIKQTQAAKFVPQVGIKKPTQERTKMTLLLGTHNPAGVQVFREVQSKVEQKEIARRETIREKGQVSLFPIEHLIEIKQARDGVGCAKYLKHAEQEVKSLLEKYPDQQAQYSDIEPRVLEQTPLKATHLKTVLKMLKDKQEISYELPGRARVPRRDTVIALVTEKQQQ